MRADSEFILSRPWDASAPPVVLARAANGMLNEVSVGPPHGISAIRRGFTGGKTEIMLAPTESLSAGRVFITGQTAWSPSVSPSGRLLAYESSQTGRSEVYVTTIPAAGPHMPVSVNGGTEPMWSRDGATLFYRGPTRMMAAMVVERPALAVTRRDSLFADRYGKEAGHPGYDVFPDGKRFLVVRPPVVVATQRSSVFVIMNWQQMLAAQRGATTER